MQDLEQLLAGALPLILIISAFLTILSSYLLLYLYRRAVIHKMSQRTQSADEIPVKTDPIETQPSKDIPSLSLAILPTELPKLTTEAKQLYSRIKSAPRQIASIYTLAGLGYAIIMALAFLLSSHIQITVVKFLAALILFTWPTAITLYIVSSTGKLLKTLVVLGYLGIAIAITLLTAAPDWSAGGKMLMVWTQEGIKILIVLLPFINRRTKSIAPLMMLFSTFAVTGIIFGVLYGIDNLRVFLNSGSFFSNAFLYVGRLFGPTAAIPFAFITVSVVCVLMFGGAGWLATRVVKYGYLSRKISDQSILIDSIWFLFAIIQPSIFVFENPWWMLSGLTAFIVFKAITLIGLKLQRKKTGITEKIPQLLLLRVFSLGKISENLYNAISNHWRYAGNVLFITGPDLATATVEPHDFLEYLSGRLATRFVDNETSLQRNLTEISSAPDPDGRFRIHDFFCYDDTWKMVLSRLVTESEVVLMDLRSFSEQNAGCRFEISELINLIPIEKVLFVIDKTTNQTFLRETIATSWAKMIPSSPNKVSSGNLNIFEYTGARFGEFQKLLQAISVATNPK